MTYSITKANIFILREAIQTLIAQLASKREEADEQAATPQELLLEFLKRDSWDASALPDGRVHVVQRGRPLVTLDDFVLNSLIGCVEAGSFVQGYGPANIRWQIRFYATRKDIVYGMVTFPAEPEWDVLVRSLLLLREATQEDRAAIQSLSRQDVDFQAGPVLLAERAGQIVAYVQHSPHPQDAALEAITKLVMRPNGRHNGYPQALIAHLQRQYSRLLASSVNPDHSRIWREMRFVLQEPADGEKPTRLTQRYLWTAPEMNLEK